MRTPLLSIVLLLMSLQSKEQTTKSNWLVGGTGSISIQKHTNSNIVLGKQTQILIDTRIGYFAATNLAIGITPMWNHIYLNKENKFNSYLLGPFVRGYLLSSEKHYNVFLGAGAGYLISLGNSRSTSDNYTWRQYSVEAGYVHFINKNIGIEVKTSYDIRNVKNMDGYSSSLDLKAGFQIYLGKKETGK
jgi:hypothetical protein